jgi:serine/threonine protein kinase
VSIYRQGEVLGVGTFAKVFEGWDALLDHPVAIKVLVPPFATHEAFVRAYLEKAAHLLDVIHEHVLATYPVDHGQSPPAVVREFADQTLEASAVGNPLPPEEVEELLRQAVAGLEAIHHRGLVHGSIRPQNLFRCGKRYKVGDFGLPPVAGAPPIPARERRYSAPEVLRGEAGGPASDLYSLGFVAYELLLGPLRFERLMEELSREAGLVSSGEYRGQTGDEIWPLFHASSVEVTPLHELLPGFPMALALTLQQMIRKDAAARLGSGGQILASLGPTASAAGVGDLPVNRAGGRRVGERPPGRTPVKGLPGGSSPAARTARPVTEGARSGPPRSAVGPATRGMKPVLYAAGGALLIVFLAGSAWLLARYLGLPRLPAQQRPAANAQLCPPIALETAADSAALAEGLRAMSGTDSSLALELDPPRAAARLPIGSEIRFRVTSGRPGHLLLFVLSSDGMLTSFYPNQRRSDIVLARGGPLELPLAEDRRDGFTLTASEPLGYDLIFALRSDRPLFPPIGRDNSPWMREYPPIAGSTPAARDFVVWAARTLCDPWQKAGLAVRELEVVR